MHAAITAIGHYLPPDVYDNAYFERQLETTDEWITSRTGIRQRHILREGGTSEMVVPAAQACLEARGLSPEEVDCIVVATITPDHFFPSTAALVQHRLGATNAWGFDLSAACSGFVFGLVTASHLVKSGAARRVLLCAADRMSAITDYSDRATAVLFGDAAAAALVEATPDPEVGVLDHVCRMDGSGGAVLSMPAGGSARPATPETVRNGEHTLRQDGRVVYRAAVEGMVSVTEEILGRNGLAREDVRWFVPHQANLRIIEAVRSRLGVEEARVMVNVDRVGNISGTTIPLCLSEYAAAGSVSYGDRLVLASFGGGFTMGAIYLRWAVPTPAGNASYAGGDGVVEEPTPALTVPKGSGAP